MNPRRPTPADLESATPLINSILSSSNNRNEYHSDETSDDNVIGGTLVITLSLIEAFKTWLLEENPDLEEKTLKGYINRVKELLGKPLEPNTLRTFVTKSKWHYAAITRLLTFLRKKYRMKQLVEELRESLGRRPRSKPDTWIPPDNLVFTASKILAGRGRIYYAAWLLLISTGARLKEIHYALAEADWDKLHCISSFCRLHIDFERGPKKSWVLYTINNIADYVIDILGSEQTPSYDTLGKAIKNSGVAAKYYRNWVGNKMLSLGIPEAVIEFIQGRTPSSVFRRHYLNLMVQADQYYPKYAAWLSENLRVSTEQGNSKIQLWSP